MGCRAVFLDRDGTINVDTHYLFKKEDFRFLPGVKESLKILNDNDFKLIIITNQSGIARGMYSEEDYLRLNEWMLTELKKSGIEISATYYCPHHPDAKNEKYRIDCNCRKPKIGLFKKAIEDFSVDENLSWAIGDKMRDLAICEESSVKGILLYSSNSECQKNIWKIKGGLKEASQKIIKGEFK